MKTKFLSFLAAALSGVLSLTSCSARPTDDVVQLRIDLDRTVLPAGATGKAVVKVCFDGLRLPRPEARPPVNLSIVIDRSGSMEGEKLARAREAALEALGRLAPDDVLSVVVYDTEVQTLVPAQCVGDGRSIASAIRGIRAGGSTALFGGVSQGASEVRKHIEDRRYIHRVILLSDGLANVGPQSPEELGRLGTALVKEGISVTTVGLGLGFNEDLMTRLAQRSDGNTYFVESSDDLPRIFAGELGDVLNVIARRVVIEVEFPEGVRPLNFVGREGVIRGRKAELTLNQLYGGQEKFALIEVEVPSCKAGSELEIATAKLSYENALTQKTTVVRTQRKVSFSESRETVVSSADQKVQNDYAANVIAETKDKAVELVDANRRGDAAKELRAKAAELKATASTYNNAPMAALAIQQEAEADKLERHGLSNAARKTYRAENAQTKSQQSSSK
ncbi:MAG: VWA domain-containing protein [Verrucomicrobia bacterium]|nr:VWA domain-containing protein [Verrucomicrobiota bacterium]